MATPVPNEGRNVFETGLGIAHQLSKNEGAVQ